MPPNRINTISDIIDSFNQFGNRTAVCEFLSDGIRKWSYSDLSGEINNLACELLQGNLKPSDRVILWAPNSAMWIAACLGIIRTGAVVIPVDAQLDRDSFVSILRDAVPTLIISSTERREELETLKKDHLFDVVYLEELQHHRRAITKHGMRVQKVFCLESKRFGCHHYQYHKREYRAGFAMRFI